jgi:hypothetical protein
MNTEGYRLMYPFVNNLTFSLETHQLLLDAIRVFGTLEDTLEDLLQKLQGEFTHREELQRLYTDFVFSAESLEEQLGLRGLPPSLYREKLLREAQKSRAIIEEYQQKEKMRHLADQAKGLERIPHPQETEERETSLLELQYQLRDKLSRRNEK